MVVQHNLTAINANRYFGINNNKLSKSLEKLSSGYAINRAGDNAAGLAVSEKMRSQIAGINQGVKNAQDGISMVQTFEGALTETDSILQRMKTLATQSANGTYQDDVDREAIQLEFNQLNDELDQIADTDFNGVVALNGGQMADGTKAVAGKFDYANQVRTSKALTKNDVEYNSLENKTWSKNANAAWAKWSDGAGAYDRTDATKAQGPDSVDITFTYKGDGTWEATGCTDGGMTLDNINGTIAYDRSNAADKSNGGFTLADGNDVFANVVVDNTKLVAGDTITLTFKNPSVANTAPENIAVATDGVDKTGITDAGNAPADFNTATVKIVNDTYSSTNNVKQTAITEDAAKLFEALNGATISGTYAAATGKVAADGTANGVTISLNNGTTSVNLTAAATTAANGVELKDADGNTIGKAYYSAADGKLTIADKNGNDMVEFTFAEGDTTGDAGGAHKTTGKVSYTLALDATNFDKGANPTVDVKTNGDPAVSKSNSNSAATAPLTYSNHVVLQVGARTKDSVDFTFKYTSNGIGDLEANMNCSSREGGLGTKDLSLLTQEDANAAIDKIDNAINKVSMVRGTFGAVQNRLEHKIDNLNTTSENLTSAESRIRDTNMAEEMMNFTKNQILSQASQSMLAQANQLPQGVLSLLQ